LKSIRLGLNTACRLQQESGALRLPGWVTIPFQNLKLKRIPARAIFGFEAFNSPMTF
jgi:hypothetical protein